MRVFAEISLLSIRSSRVDAASKERILTVAIETLRERGYRFVTLAQAALAYGLVLK